MPMYQFTVSIAVTSDEGVDTAEQMLESALENLTGGDIFGFTIEGGDEA